MNFTSSRRLLPDPAVSRTCAKSRAVRLLLRSAPQMSRFNYQ